MLKPNETHFLGQVNQKALIKKDGKILLVQYSRDVTKHPNPKARGKWDMPGGRLNVGEDVIAGLKREVLEEIGVEIKVDEILTTGTFTNLNGQQNFFVIYQASIVDENKPFQFNDGEAEKVRWVVSKEFFSLPVIYSEYQEALKTVLQ